MGGLETKLERKLSAGIQSIMTLPDAPAIAPAASSDGGNAVRFGFENTYARLPEHFYARVDPTPVATPRLIRLNGELARKLGMSASTTHRSWAITAAQTRPAARSGGASVMTGAARRPRGSGL